MNKFKTNLSMFFLSIAFGPIADAGQFCVIGPVGHELGCYPTATTCKERAASLNGVCVFRDGASGSSTGPEDPFSRGYQQGQMLGELLFGGQRRAQEGRNAMDPRLLPLAPPNDYLNQATQGLIFTALNQALEFDSVGGSRTFQNPNTGTNGVIRITSDLQSRSGKACRSFSIGINFRGTDSRQADGTACLSENGWAW